MYLLDLSLTNAKFNLIKIILLIPFNFINIMANHWQKYLTNKNPVIQGKFYS